MPANTMYDKLSELEQCIHTAAGLCQMSDEVPPRVRECVRQLARQSDRALEASGDGEVVADMDECLATMEETGDRALQAFDNADYVDVALQNAVRQARKAISAARRQLY